MKNVTFYLGPAPDIINTRVLTITRMHDASDGTTSPSATHDADAGQNEFVTVQLASNRIWQARLVDTLDSGEVGSPQVIQFHTGDNAFPGAKSSVGFLQVFAIEDVSSTSSASSSSVSSSSATSVSSASSGESSQSSSSPSSSSSSLSSSSSPSSSSASSVSSVSSVSSNSSSNSSSSSSSSSSTS